jgi:hypothetical protein
MNRIVLIITLFFSFSLVIIEKALAQRHLPGQKGIQLTAGAVDGFKLKKEAGQAYCFGIALSSYTGNGNRWLFGGEYLQKQYAYKEKLIPVSQYTAEAGYYINFLSDPSKTFFFSFGGSLMAGYETVNKGKEVLDDGATIMNKDKFLYGGAFTFEIETYLSDRFVLLLNVRERLLFGSEINKFHTQVSAGFKVIIN